MLSFGNHRGGLSSLKSGHARAPLTPERKPETIVHPLNAPRTILRAEDYPKDFNKFEYAGAAIEPVTCQKPDGSIIRRPALVALMVRKRQAGDTFVEEEMTVSVRDLQTFIDPKTGIRGYHDTRAVTAALDAFYDNKIPLNQQETAHAQAVTANSTSNNGMQPGKFKGFGPS